MEKVLSQFNWRTALENTKMDAIDNDFILLEKPVKTQVSSEPFKADVTTVVFCTNGSVEGAINLKPFIARAPCLIAVLPDQILEQKYMSDDFSGSIIVMSKQFTDNLLPNAQDRLTLNLSVRNNPCQPLNTETLNGMRNYFETMKRVIQFKENPHRIEVARYLMLAFFYGVGFSFHPQLEDKKQSHYELLVEKFMNLVQSHYKHERLLSFYADKLCLTPKHLSKVIKDTSGKSANDWIDDYVILEAKALLISTNMTVQQICDELNFECQSFFGKYFKRLTGMSPREYKGKR
jgi:AraC family transcriptional regulator, transcriptional activator of pobA